MSFSGRPNAVYYIFDRWDIPKGFEQRHSMLVSRFGEGFAGYIRVVPHTEVSSCDEMLIHEAEYLQKGYEGVMLRLPNAAYKQNRSTLREAGLVKVKRFNDHEAVIIGWERLYRNHNEAEELIVTSYDVWGRNCWLSVSARAPGTLCIRSLRCCREWLPYGSCASSCVGTSYV